MAHYNPWATWSPGGVFGDLRRDLDSVFDRYGRSGGVGAAAGRGAFPPVNLYETSGGYVLTAELPGIPPADIHVSLEGATVTIDGERRDADAGEGVAVHRRERATGRFRRAFELPNTIEGDKVEAFHRNGVLMLRLPKAPEHQPRRIAVNPS